MKIEYFNRQYISFQLRLKNFGLKKIIFKNNDFLPLNFKYL